jgi:NADH-quinone oxidoreductase subunit J
MNAIFYISAAVAVVSTGLVITRADAVHSLLCLVVSLISVSLIFFVLGAPFIAALEVIIYAGAIMVVFVFVVMMLNLGPVATEQEREWLNFKNWRAPAGLALILLVEMLYLLKGNASTLKGAHLIEPKELGLALYGPYILVVELASMLLLAGLVGAYHLGRKDHVPSKELKS